MLYNLIVRDNDSRFIDKSRMFENCRCNEWRKYITQDGFDYEGLAKLPTIITREFNDGDESAFAVLGYMDEPSANPQVSTPILIFKSKKLKELGVLDAFENNRTHWTLREGDPFRRFYPYANVFDRTTVPVSDENVGSFFVAVAMEFSNKPEECPIYEAIKDATESLDIDCKRADEIYGPGNIVDDIFDLLNSCSVVIADITGLNSNVMYEVGFAQAKDKQIIFITQDELSDLPFDISHQRVLKYSNLNFGLNQLAEDLKKSLSEIKITPE